VTALLDQRPEAVTEGARIAIEVADGHEQEFVDRGIDGQDAALRGRVVAEAVVHEARGRSPRRRARTTAERVERARESVKKADAGVALVDRCDVVVARVEGAVA